MDEMAHDSHLHIPVVDISALVSGTTGRYDVAARIGQACCDSGFFYVINHGVDEDLHMSRGGRAWRGYFPVGGELTSGKPDLKEGIYFGAELKNVL